jgi:hypothetical protein
MSRSGYTDDDCEEYPLALWRGAVNSAIKGKRGQAFLRDLIAALESMPTKRLIDNELEENGEVCALGSVGRQRGLDMASLDLWDWGNLAKSFGIAEAMAREIMYVNDEAYWGPGHETPEARWQRMYEWAKSELTASSEGEHAKGIK